MLSLLLAILSMALRDALGTWLTIAEARGRAVLAGILDGLYDLASIGVTLYAAGQVLIHGWSMHSILVLAAVTITSTFGTMLWTKVGQRIGADKGKAPSEGLAADGA